MGFSDHHETESDADAKGGDCFAARHAKLDTEILWKRKTAEGRGPFG
jgi:hypothetical protein